MKLYEKYKALFTKYGVTTPLRIAHFMAQIEHESNLQPIEENLNYSWERLLKVFPKYFNEKNVRGYNRFPKAIANVVYANRMGNGDYNSGDGYKYRGRGFIQLTGKSNYVALSKDTGIDFVNNPDLLLSEVDAMVCALWFWNKNGLNDFADKDDINSITKRINGGFNGLEHRKELLVKYKKELGA
jgi:putative chitinase